MALECIIIHIQAGDSPPDLVMAGLPCRFTHILLTGVLADTGTVTDTDIAGDIIMDTIMDTGQDTQEADTIPEMFTNRDLPESDQQQGIGFPHNR